MQRTAIAVGRAFAPMLVAIAGLCLTACQGPVLQVGVNVVTQSCDNVDEFAKADTVKVTAYGADFDSTVFQKEVPVAQSSVVLASLPIGKARNIVVEGFQSGNPEKLIARGESGPIDLEKGAPTSITIFIHPIDSFSHVTSYPSDPNVPNVCTALAQGRAAHTATVLENGKVLIAGGYAIDPMNPSAAPTYLNSTELFDPTTGTITAGPRLGVARAFHTATHIPGTPLTVIAGGEGKNNTAIPVAEIFDESQNSFTAVPLSEHNGRTRHTAVLAPDVTGGVQVLLIGGYSGTNAKTAQSPLYSGEAFDINQHSFSQAFTFPNNAGLAEAGALVFQGRVLVEGGWTGTAPNTTGYFLAPNQAGGYDVIKSAPGSAAPHLMPVLAPIGDGTSVVLAGGFGARNMSNGTSTLSSPSVVTEFWHGTSKFVEPAGIQLSQAAGGGDAATLPDGSLLVVGGEYVDSTSMMNVSSVSADIFRLDPNASAPALLKQKPSPGAMKDARFLHRLTVLPDGRVLVSGGIDYTGDGKVNLVTKFEIYEPHYVANGNDPHSQP